MCTNQGGHQSLLNKIKQLKFIKMLNMKLLSKTIILLFLIGNISIISSCNKKDIAPTDFGIFSSQDENTAIMNGVIGTNTPEHWDNYFAANPNTHTIIMKKWPGSEDDTANLKVARKVSTQNIIIHLPADAEIASGAVDFYLAGISRTREAGSKIGVHSWSDGSHDATSFPVGHANHQPYIDYYKEVGFSQANAEAFYYFTINIAAASSIHWMTDAEIEQYKLLKP